MGWDAGPSRHGACLEDIFRLWNMGLQGYVGMVSGRRRFVLDSGAQVTNATALKRSRLERRGEMVEITGVRCFCFLFTRSFSFRAGYITLIPLLSCPLPNILTAETLLTASFP